MAAARCPYCRHYYVLDTQSRPECHCPRCRKPLQPLSRAELQSHIRNGACGAHRVRSLPEIAFRPLSLAEIERLVEAVTGAHDRAVGGQAARGYGMLFAGLCRAKRQRCGGDPGEGELVKEWQSALDTYRDLYGGQ